MLIKKQCDENINHSIGSETQKDDFFVKQNVDEDETIEGVANKESIGTSQDSNALVKIATVERPTKFENDCVEVNTEVREVFSIFTDQGVKMNTRDAIRPKKGFKALFCSQKAKAKPFRENIILSNRFAPLNEDEGQFTLSVHTEEANKMLMIGKRNLFHVRKVKQSSRKINHEKVDSCVPNSSKIKYMRSDLKSFETENRFDVLKGNEKMDSGSVLKAYGILRKAKQSLKRCKKCNYKKRTCALDPKSCKATHSICFKCKKIGHFPKSMSCKANKISKSKCCSNNQHSRQWKKDVLLLVTKRIFLLETLAKMAELRRVEEQRLKEIRRIEEQRLKELITMDLIPFLLMFIFVNPDIFYPKAGKNDDAEAILKQATLCAKRFSKDNQQFSQFDFAKYCSKKINKVILNRKMENVNWNTITNLVDVYNQGDIQQCLKENFTNHCQEGKIIYETVGVQNSNPVTNIIHSNDQIMDNIDALKRIKLCGGGDHVCKYFKDKEYENYNENLYRTNIDKLVSREDVCQDNSKLPQLDGLEDQDLRKPEKHIYGINCEIREIVQLINFIRSFNFLWITPKSHWMCSQKQRCFFCYIRSSCLRLRKERKRGPKNIQLNEYANQLDQYMTILNWDCLENLSDFPIFIENTLRLIHTRENISPFFHTEDPNCNNCKHSSESIIIKIENVKLVESDEALEMKDLIEMALLKRNQNQKCCHKMITYDNLEDLCIIVQLSHADSVNIIDGEKFHGSEVLYRSHSEIHEVIENQAFFRYDNLNVQTRK